MTGSKRREELINTIKSSTSPISGKTLAQLYDVSRQVIVQDIALLRTAGYDIISTNRGYILNAPHTITRVFKVSHTDAQTEDELYSIVDLGGTVVNVMVNHRVYGHMEAPLGISSRLKVKAFIDDIKNGKSSPLKNITSNYHYHTVEADSEKTLDLIEKTLEEKGYDYIKRDQIDWYCKKRILNYRSISILYDYKSVLVCISFCKDSK